jgi:hypothetical protein
MKRNRAFQMLISCAALVCGADVGLMAGSPPQGSQLVRDLRASRKGDKVTLTWSQPRAVAIRESATENLIIARICRSMSPTPPSSTTVADDSTLCAQTVGSIDVQKPVAAGVRVVYSKNSEAAMARFVDTLPLIQEETESLQFAVYTVKLQDARGHQVGLSNAASIPLAPVLPAKGLHSELDARGVYLIWDSESEKHHPSLKFDYRIYRSEKGSVKAAAIPYARAVIHTEEGERWSGVDTNIEWEKTYSYRVTPVTRVYGQGGELIAEIEGDDSAPVEVITHDVFPPAAPERLLAVVTQSRGENFVSLLWAPNAEKDISQYNVYRREQKGEAARINSVPVSVLSFQDDEVVAAHIYFYSISAVDQHGHESARSQEAKAVLR